MRTYTLIFFVLLAGYGSTGWGEGHAAGTIAPWDEPHITTALLHTNQPHTDDALLSAGAAPISIGEIATYETTLIFSGGAYSDAQLSITLGSGLAFVDVQAVDVAPGLVSDAPGGGPRRWRGLKLWTRGTMPC